MWFSSNKPKTETLRLTLKNVGVVGVTFEGRQEVISKLQPGEKVEFMIVKTDKATFGEGVQVWIGGKNVGWLADQSMDSMAYHFRKYSKMGYAPVNATYRVIGITTRGIELNIPMEKINVLS